MKSSLTTRLARTLFFLIAATIAASMVTVELFVDDVEDTILGLELKADAEYFIEQIRKGQFRPIKTARLESVFLPDSESETSLPGYFQGQSMPFSREVEVGETTLLIYGEETQAPAGRLFLAQDITIMENREFLVQLVLLGVAVGMLLIGFFVARAGAGYLVGPFKRLTKEVQGTEPGQSMRRVSDNYPDQEFCDIAGAFNRFLSELEGHIEREKSFVNLASHELRTPLAVMSGALDVLDQRKSLTAADRKTLGRIRSAVQFMRDDTEVLLELARGETSSENHRTVSVREVIQTTVDDLEHGNLNHVGRITVINDNTELKVRSNPALVRMLLRNLLQNALRHTQSAVEVRVLQNRISVKDHGGGLPRLVTERFKADQSFGSGTFTAGESSSATFGLLIVRLVCERLGWELRISQSDSEGTEFLIQLNESR